MPATITVKPVAIEIDNKPQNSETLNLLADKEGVGHGGDLLSKALVEVLNTINSEENIPKGTTTELLNNLERFIDIAVGEAIRDIAVRGEVLKRQLLIDPRRKTKVTDILSKIHYIKGISMFGKSDDLEGQILGGLDELDGKDNIIDELEMHLQEWIEEDGIEGVYSEDLTWHIFNK